MKEILAFVLFSLALLSFVSCGNNQEKIIGVWEFSEIKPELKGEARSKEFRIKQMSKELKGELYIFQEDGKGLHVEDGITKEIAYILNDQNELTINEMSFKVSSLTGKKMSWFFDLEGAGGVRMTYIKQ